MGERDLDRLLYIAILLRLMKESTSPWVPAEYQPPPPGEKPITIAGSTIPIRNVDVGPVRFEMWAEEAKIKGKLPQRGEQET
jgi:hypothetical protein